MTPRVTMREALTDPGLLGGALGGPTWHAWRVLLIAAMGEPLEPSELATFTALTGRSEPPPSRIDEFWAVVGRRGGKSRAMAALGCYLASLCDWTDKLVAGEQGLMMMIAPDTRQAGVLLGYCDGMLQESPVLSGVVMNRTADTLTLRGGIALEVRSSSFRRLRGASCIGLVADEAAFYASDGANPDSEILAAVRPALASTGGPVAVISSPYSKKGEVFEAYKRHFADGGDPLILVAQAPSRTLNPSLPASVVDRALARDPIAARAEYLAEFRSDIAGYVTIEAVEAVTAKGVFERPPVRATRYHAGIDPSGGVRDSMTLAISHREGDVAVLDLIREAIAPFSPESVTAEFAADMRRYGCRTARMDRYGAAWVEQAFRRHGITARPAEHDRSGLYQNLLPALNSGQVSLLDNARLASQLVALERRTGRNGRDIIDHSAAADSHDDVANACALSIGMALAQAERRVMLAGPQIRHPLTRNLGGYAC